MEAVGHSQSTIVWIFVEAFRNFDYMYFRLEFKIYFYLNFNHFSFCFKSLLFRREIASLRNCLGENFLD